FREQSLVHEVVRRALMEALGQGDAPLLQLRPEVLANEPASMSIPGVLAGGVFPSRWFPSASGRPGDGGTIPPGPGTLAGAAEWERGSDRHGSLAEIRPMIPLGQFRETFIIAVDDEGVAIIDQHVAHERVLFERVMQRLTSGPLESQRLLVPILLEVAPSAHDALVNRASDLQRLGFEIES